ncbi:hypothetical protein TDB9533_04740 [Thalassocella blandensis]|nr:hypothetical protein TDB9533_04740 [Thalassocella blandensis]
MAEDAITFYKGTEYYVVYRTKNFTNIQLYSTL